MSKKVNFTFGADPEWMICDGSGMCVPLPVLVDEHGFNWESENDEKHPVLHEEPGEFKVIMDGVAAELTLPPARSGKDMWKHLNSAYQYLSSVVIPLGMTVQIVPTVKYNYEKFYSDRSFYRAWMGIFGCDKDRDILDPGYDSPDIDATTHQWRYAGGHIHISDNNEFVLHGNAYPILLSMCLVVGTFCISNCSDPQGEGQRAWKYGQPGRYRPQLYSGQIQGLEYRTPSCDWTQSEEKVLATYDMVARALTLARNAALLTEVADMYLNRAIEAISKADVNLAREINHAVTTKI